MLLQEWLRERGIDASSVYDEGLIGRADLDIAAAAATEHRMLITLDRGFADIRVHPPGTHPGILVLRPATQGARSVLNLMARLLDGVDLADLAGTVTIVEPGRLRIRRPE